MVRQSFRLIGLVMLASLVQHGTTQGGPLCRFFQKTDCPRPSYSPLNYWAPELNRVYHNFHGPMISQYAEDQYPGVPAPVIIDKYPCPAADPAAMYLNTNRPYDPTGPYFSPPDYVAPFPLFPSKTSDSPK